MTESAFADQFAGRAAPIYLDGYTGIDTAATSPEDSGAAEPWKNGTYRAEKTGYDQGYRAFVEITVTDGRITAVNWDAEKQDSDLTKKQESENGTYIMTEDGLRWHEKAAVMEAALMQTPVSYTQLCPGSTARREMPSLSPMNFPACWRTA